MGRFKNSWDITKATFQVMRKEGELFAYPFFSAGLSLLLFIALFLPFILSLLSSSPSQQLASYYVFIIVVYFGIHLIKVFFDVATSYTAAEGFVNRSTTIKETMRFCFGHFGTILSWALFSATIGILLNLLESLGRKAGIGAIVARIISWIVGLAWKISTLFVIPVIVYEDAKPFAAVKSSVDVLKKTWGESLIKWAGVNLISTAAFFAILVLVFIPAFFIAIAGSVTVGVLLFALGILLLVAVSLVLSVADKVFNTALYIYAKTGIVPDGYSQEQIDAAFKQK